MFIHHITNIGILFHKIEMMTSLSEDDDVRYFYDKCDAEFFIIKTQIEDMGIQLEGSNYISIIDGPIGPGPVLMILIYH